jgi:pimeloyl-ACP methyl ester carboxylesterase
VIVGGFTALSRSYGELAEILREVSGSEVRVVPLTPLDWAAGYFRGYGQLAFEIATAVDQALLESPADKAVLVGHSAGGVACRIYLGGDPPYGGRRFSGHRYVSRLITLGSPHAVADHKHLAPIHRVNELFPGAPHRESGLEYLSVAGSAVDGSTSPKARKRYERFVEDGRQPGDGAMPVEAALLPGAEHLILVGSEMCIRDRYGADTATAERWWPQEPRANGRLVEERRA